MLSASGSGCSGCMAPSGIIPGSSLQMPDIQLLMLSTWSGRVATARRTWIFCRLTWWRGSGKGTVTCALLWMRSIYSGPAAWVKGGGDTGVCGAGVRCNGLIGGAAVLLAANGMIRTAKQLPEVSRTAVWGRAALCLAGASCDWWGGNIVKLLRLITYC